MRAFIFVTCLVATALARPEAPGGYNYSGLQRGLPKNAHQLKPHVHQQLPAEHSFANFAAPTSNYLPPSAAPTLPTPDHLQQLGNTVSPVEDSPPPQTSQALPLPLSHHEDSYNTAYHQSADSHESGGYPYTPQTTIHKHIYVHVPPKDFENEDVITTRVHHQPAPKQKHYKIVFIKAPAAPSIRPPVVPPPPQHEEKTLIYVLHKKPDQEQDIVIPTAPPTKPSKPEVYFIKYKTKKEEAPVYGPPPSQQQQLQNLGIEPRNIDTPTAEYGAPTIDSFPTESHADSSAPLTTVQPAAQESSDIQHQVQQQQQQFGVEVPSEVYGAPPTMTAVIVPEEPQPTLAAPSNQYLTPDAPQTMSPIIVEEPQPPQQPQQPQPHHVPSNKYGPPNRFFIKKKK